MPDTFTLAIYEALYNLERPGPVVVRKWHCLGKYHIACNGIGVSLCCKNCSPRYLCRACDMTDYMRQHLCLECSEKLIINKLIEANDVRGKGQ